MKKIVSIVFWVLVALMIIGLVLICLDGEMPIASEFWEINDEQYNMIEVCLSSFSIVATLFLGYVTYRQNDVANKTNERLFLQGKRYQKSYIQLKQPQTQFVKMKDGYQCQIYGENISGVPIVSVDYDMTDMFIKDLDFEVVTIRTNVAYSCWVQDNGVHFSFVDPYISDTAFVLCFKLILTGLYGYKTVQKFNIVVKGNTIFMIETKEEESEKQM